MLFKFDRFLEKIEELNKFLWNLGYKIKGSKDNIHPKAFAEVLEEIQRMMKRKACRIYRGIKPDTCIVDFVYRKGILSV